MAKPRVALPKKIRNTKPMDWRWVDYSYAQHIVQRIGITSARQYQKWYNDCSPAGFPLKPQRTYPEWVSWNEFLGGNNCYAADHPTAVRKKDLLPYWDAVNLIQAMQLKTVEEYLQAFDDGLIPAGIPRLPHQRYKVFYVYGGYKNWLGKDIKHRLEATKNINPLLVLYQSGQQPNVISILIHKKGVQELRDIVRERNLKVIRVYHWYDEFGEGIFDILNHFGTKQNDTTWMFSNVNEVLFELGSVLEVFNP